MMGVFMDLTGQTFGRWKVIRNLTRRSSKGSPPTTWLCRCDCGTERSVWAGDLRGGTSRSCGCKTDAMRREISSRRRIHGHARSSVGAESREYHSWTGAKQRCTNPKSKDRRSYAGRGIVMCQRWAESFADFFADMGPCPPGMTLDRIDNDGNYEPCNCRWATLSQQNANRRPFKINRRKRTGGR